MQPANMNPRTPLAQSQSARLPRRLSTSIGPVGSSNSAPRPSTSSGEVLDTIQAENPFLRAALKGTPDRARSTTPRRQRPTFRSQSYKDEWIQSSSDEKEKKIRSPVQRNPRQRRASEVIVSQHASSVSTPLGSRATTNRLDKLEKENWDLKHRITLFQDSAQKLKSQLEEHQEAGENLIIAKDHIKNLSKELESALKERDSAMSKNVHLSDAVRDLEQQLEDSYVEHERLAKDAADRQGAIIEAAGIIQAYASRLKAMEAQIHQYQQQSRSMRGDSDYYSAEAEVTQRRAVSTSTKTALADSDYFSADTSPASESRLANQRAASEASPSLRAARTSSAAFNQEIDATESIPPDSLLLKCLQNPQPADTASSSSSLSSRLLRLRSIRKRTQSPSSASAAESQSVRKTQLVVPVDSMPLRNLYASGESRSNDSDVPTPSPKTQPQGYVAQSDTLSFAKSSPASSMSNDITNANPVEAQASSSHSKRNSISSSMYSKLLSFRSSAMTAKSTSGLHRQNTTPVTPTVKPQVSPLPPVTQRRYSTDGPRPRSLTFSSSSSSSSQRRLSRSPAQHLVTGTPSTPGATLLPITSPSIDTRNTIPLISPTYATPPAQTAPTYSAIKPTTKTHRSPPTPNFSHWPRRYPAWPPSAGLVNRDLLFHGDDGNDRSSTTESEPSP